MALLRIRLFPDPVLSVPARSVPEEDIKTEAFQKFLDDMYETMLLEDGVGLAAQQVGMTLRVAVLGQGGKRWDLINPERIDNVRTSEIGDEGCLSLEGMVFRNIPRITKICVRYTDRTGAKQIEEFEGFLARAVQHELDHLGGRLLIDRLLGPLSEKKQAIKAQEFAERIQVAYSAKVAGRKKIGAVITEV